MKILYPPLADDLCQLFLEAKTDFFIVSPWLKTDALQWLLEKRKSSVNLSVLTVGNLEHFLGGSSDIEAFEQLLQLRARIRLISNLHAKIYLADKMRAIVASANLTPSGLEHNLELGVLIDDDEVAALAQKLDEWFCKGRQVDAQWLSEMQTSLVANEVKKEGQSLKQVNRQLRQRGKNLRGSRVNLAYSTTTIKTSKAKGDEWIKQIEECFKEDPQLAQEVVIFFQSAFKRLPDQTFQEAWFGIHSRYISLTVGNIWLASVCFQRRGEQEVYLLVDNDWDDLAKSTKNYVPLGWKVYSRKKLVELNRAQDVWDAYARASEQIWASPISRNIIRKNLENKQKLPDFARRFRE